MTKIFVLKNYLHTNIDKKQIKGLFYLGGFGEYIGGGD